MSKEMIQTVIITMSDGQTYFFTGKAAVKKGDKRLVIDIKFVEERPLPEDYSLEVIPQKVELKQ